MSQYAVERGIGSDAHWIFDISYMKTFGTSHLPNCCAIGRAAANPASKTAQWSWS
jgi:hypothetical protein